MLPKQLMFTVGLVDQITKPIAKISKQFSGLASNYQAGTMKMATGIGGVAAAGMSLYESLQPALEIDKALKNAKGIGVTSESIKELSKTAMNYSLEYGVATTEVIKHAEKMRGVLGNVSTDILMSTTRSSALLGQALQADADTVSKYFKNLHGNYKNEVNELGQDNFIAKIAGMTAYAKKTFGTELSELEGMIDGMHSLPSTLGVSMEEQFAVLSMLNKQMGQGDAVTQYTNYLENIRGAQEKLGVSLTNGNGKMLPILDVVKKLKPLMAGMTDDQSWQILDKAGLGDGSLMLINMVKNIDELKAGIKGYQNIKGADPLINMVKDMTDQSQRLSQSWFVIRAAFGTAILPVFNEFAGWLADTGRDLVKFTEQHPTLTKYIGISALALLGLVAAGGLFTLMMGAGQMASVAWGVALIAKAGIVSTLTLGLSGLRSVLLAVNIAMYANPIGLIVAGIAAAVIAVGALIYYWDDLKATMGEWGWVKAISGIFDSVWKGIKSVFTDTLNWIIDKLNMIPGVDIELNTNVNTAVNETVKQTAPLTNKQVMQTAQLGNVIPLPTKGMPIAQQKQNNVIPFAQPIVPANAIKPQQQNNVIPFAQPIVPFAQQTTALNKPVVPTAITNEAKKTRDLVSRPDNLIELPTAKVERSKAQPIFNNNNKNNNANSSDNSRKVFIESINMKSDNPSEFINNMLELAG